MPKNSKKETEKQDEEKLFKILEYQQKQLLDQHEKIDKWFRFYLLIIGAPFAILTGFFQTGKFWGLAQKDIIFIVLGSFSLFIIGIFFFVMNIYQRINMITIFFRKMIPIEKKLYEKLPLFNKKIDHDELEKLRKVFEDVGPNPYGAEFWARTVYMFINSLWGAMFIFSVTLLLNSSAQICNYVITIITFVIIFAIQMCINSCKLSKYECRTSR